MVSCIIKVSPQTVKVRFTLGAGSQMLSPACEAEMVHRPEPLSSNVSPLTTATLLLEEL